MSKVKWNYILGTVTISAIIGGTIYVIIKSKQAEKIEEDAITLEEARDIMAQAKFEKGEETVRFEAPIDVYEENAPRQIKGIKVSDMEMEEAIDELLEDDEDEINGDDPVYDKNLRKNDLSIYSVEPLNDFMYEEEGIDPKEDKELRHDPNSDEARHQFIRMEMADWSFTHPVYRILIPLFEIPFVPTNDGDEILRTQIIDYKVQFYGFKSKWVKEVSFADVIFHYARGAEFNCGETVQYWVEYFLDFNDFAWDTTSAELDMLIMRLNSHTYFNEERQTFGLFGLTRESMDQAIRTANMNLDRSVTYEIEFQEFLKSCL